MSIYICNCSTSLLRISVVPLKWIFYLFFPIFFKFSRLILLVMCHQRSQVPTTLVPVNQPKKSQSYGCSQEYWHKDWSRCVKQMKTFPMEKPLQDANSLIESSQKKYTVNSLQNLCQPWLYATSANDPFAFNSPRTCVLFLYGDFLWFGYVVSISQIFKLGLT